MADRWQRQPGSQTVVNYGKAGWTLQIIKGVARRSGAMANPINSVGWPSATADFGVGRGKI